MTTGAKRMRISRRLKARVVEILRDRGVNITTGEEAEIVRYQAECRLLPAKHKEPNADYFMRVIAECAVAKRPRYKGKIVPPRAIAPLRKNDPGYVMELPANPRAAQILDLPHPVSVGGIGCWNKFTDWYAREGL